MKLQASAALIAAACTGTAVAGGPGDLVQIGPFKGDFFEGFENVPSGDHVSLDVFDSLGKVTAIGEEAEGAPVVDVLAGIVFGIHLQARSGTLMMGTTFDDAGFTPAVRWSFNTPAKRFGGYFATVNFTAGATAFFYDQDNTLIATTEVIAPNNEEWAWNGWEVESGGISRVDVFGNGSFGPGLVFYDDMEFTPIPAPPAMTIMLLGLPMLRRRRRCRPSAD